jgi:hypothetical protein
MSRYSTTSLALLLNRKLLLLFRNSWFRNVLIRICYNRIFVSFRGLLSTIANPKPAPELLGMSFGSARPRPIAMTRPSMS